jgi:hypothetical protein
MKSSYLLAVLCLLPFAGCSNSPPPPPYVPPPVPVISTFPTPVPPPSEVLDTRQFIDAGRAAGADAGSRPRLTPLDREIRRRFNVTSMSQYVAYQLNEINRSNSKLAADGWARRSKSTYESVTFLTEALPQSNAVSPDIARYRASLVSMERMALNTYLYAKTKYDLLNGLIPPLDARQNMNVYRSRALTAALQSDRLMIQNGPTLPDTPNPQ